MSASKYIAYYRVSTLKQGQSGLGLEAQQLAVAAYLQQADAYLQNEFTEIETGKGANALAKRPQLRAALDACRKQNAVLIIAKLDRLARNVHFVSGLLETGVEFVAADMPQANKVMIQMYSVMAEWERDQISARTKSALAAAKARGVILGSAGSTNLKHNIEERKAKADAFAKKLEEVIRGFQAIELSHRAMKEQLNQLGIPAARGGKWSLVQVQRLLSRLASSNQAIVSLSTQNI